MAYNDYELIVYKVLKYLYDCLKAGESIECVRLTRECYDIPASYWEYILIGLLEDGYIRGITATKTKDGYVFSDLTEAQITPKGIEYLHENTAFKKVKRFLKEAKETIPGI